MPSTVMVTEQILDKRSLREGRSEQDHGLLKRVVEALEVDECERWWTALFPDV